MRRRPVKGPSLLFYGTVHENPYKIRVFFLYRTKLAYNSDHDYYLCGRFGDEKSYVRISPISIATVSAYTVK
ncbi:hypothetical protein J2Z65_000353 [Paenibacillus aceris]|uniref:Uncharacterized protein n=1 Tax=Paenibacillus aceris TaxID=869555 RepID=A0ABS4HRC0_9BACL|nr:hypothetical protein [Paenibacillus aceris]